MDIQKLIQDNKQYIINLRRHFHMYPELSFQEHETTQKIAQELDKLGIPYFIPEEEPKTGVIAWIQGKNSDKVVGLRADIDALNVKENNSVGYKSQIDGKMHACGHDAHIAMLLGAAKILNEMKDEINGKIYLIFQPAEEIGMGAPYMIRQGTWFDEIDNMYGSHIWSVLETGKISVESGERMAAADRFKIKIYGKSGHGSMPHQTVDAVVVGCAVVQALQHLVSRNYSPLDSVTVTVGSFHSGNRFNIISGEAEMEGTNRYFTKEIADRIENDMNRVIKGVCDAYGATYEMEYKSMFGPTINDEHSSHIAEKVAEKLFGKSSLTKMIKTTGGEDFSYYLKEKPGCFAFIGSRNKKIGTHYPHHNENFNIDEDVLTNGTGMYVQYAIDFLNE